MASHEEEEQELALFGNITIYDESEGEHFYSFLCKPEIPKPPAPPLDYEEKFVDFETYIKEKCHDKVKILDRHSFHDIDKPFLIGFNHFREKCQYYIRYIDMFYQLALSYGDRIVFLLGDVMDIDVICVGQNPVNHFCTSEDLRVRWLILYAIDGRKRIQQCFEQNLEGLTELCELLLSGELYQSQPIPEPMEGSLVKLCVHLNYHELVEECPRHVFLAASWGDYRENMPHEPDYEQIAQTLKEFNVDVVYLNAYENFMPFNISRQGYPLFAFISAEDKKNPIYFTGFQRTTENLIDFVLKNLKGETEFWLKEMHKCIFKPFELPSEEEEKINLHNLQEYLKENYSRTFKVMDRKKFESNINAVLIYFMDFKQKSLAHYMDILKKLHQIAEGGALYHFDFLIADIQDIDMIYPEWYKKYLPSSNIEKPKVFARDMKLRWFEAHDFPSVTSIFIYCFDLIGDHYFRSQPWAASHTNDKIKSCGASNLKFWLQKSKSHIFLTFYWSTYKEAHKILSILEDICEEANEMDVQLMKIDAKHNYIPLEYSYAKYPVHFLIPKDDKVNGTIRYISNQECEPEDIMEFLRSHIRKEEK